MKVRTLKRFKDVHTGEIHEANKEMEISEERYEELKKAGDYVEPLKEDEDWKKMDMESLRKMKVEDLRSLAKERGLDDTGKKEDLIARIAGQEEAYEESED